MKTPDTTPLAIWLHARGMKIGWFAQQAGLSYKQVYPAIKGGALHPNSAHAIVRATAGAVDYNALYSGPGGTEDFLRSPSLVKAPK